MKIPYPESEFFGSWLTVLAGKRKEIHEQVIRLTFSRQRIVYALLENNPELLKPWSEDVLHCVADACWELSALGVETAPGVVLQLHPTLWYLLAPALSIVHVTDANARREWLNRGFRTSASALLSAHILLLNFFSQLHFCTNHSRAEIEASDFLLDVLHVYRFIK